MGFITARGDNVHNNLVSGDTNLTKKAEGHKLAAKDIKKFKVQTKKYEIEESLKIMLRDNIIRKQDFVSLFFIFLIFIFD